MQLTFLGVRGSYPVADRRMGGVGGNSASIMLCRGGEVAFLDAGTGIITGGRRLLRMRRRGGAIPIFLTHLHMDHIQGLPFFPPIYDPACILDIYCPLKGEVDLQSTIESLFLPPFSPVTPAGIKAKVRYHRLDAEKDYAATIGGGIRIEYRWHACHPLLGSAVYRISHNGRSVVYATDIESPGGLDPKMARFIRGADILIHDAQYRDRDYHGGKKDRRGFGHSPVSAAAKNARQCDAKKLFLFHYDPRYTDAMVATMLRQARKAFKATQLATERFKINLRS